MNAAQIADAAGAPDAAEAPGAAGAAGALGAASSGSLPPLVEPGPELTADQISRYRRQITLAQIGTLGQRRLRAASVLVVGAGGLGSPALQYLAGAGIGTLGIVDDDVVDVTNLHRQVVHGMDALGEPKAESAAAAVARINPEVAVRVHRERVSAQSVLDLVRGYDVILDGTDNFATRYIVADASEITGIPVVWGAILRGHGQVSVFWPGRGAHYRDVFPEPPAPGEAPSCAEAGVLGTLPGLLGTIMTTQVIQLITGTGTPLVGRLLLWDEATSTTRTLRIAPDPDRTPAARVEVPAAADPACAIGGPGAEETLRPAELRALLAASAGDAAGALGGEITLIDVREPWEFTAGAIEGAVNVPLDRVLEGGASALPRGDDVVLYCQGGVRSAKALERLRADWATREGRLRHLDGGYAAWEAQAG